jgi:Ca-activated chloride channel family protein
MQHLSTSWLSAVFLIPACAIVVGSAAHCNAQPGEFRVNSDLVVLPVSITDRAGRAVVGLEPSDFVIAEDGAARQVVAFSRWDAPASIGIIFDASGSMKGGIRTAQSAVRSLLHENDDGDETFLISFADSPRLEVDFTRDAEEISNRLLWATPKGATALFDAIYAGITKVKHAANSRRALVVMTDGGDNHSRHSFKELLSAVRESDVQIFAVAVRRNTHDFDEQRGRLQLEQLAKETGGHLLIVGNDAELPHAMQEVNDLIRNQYLLSYRPEKLALDGKWHRVRVRLHPASKGSLYRIYTKNGYYAPTQ